MSFSIVWKSAVMRPVILSSVGTGIFFIGIFMVTLPLIVTDIFGGGQLEISILNFTFLGRHDYFNRRHDGAPTCRTAWTRHDGGADCRLLPSLVPLAPSFAAVCAIAGAGVWPRA